MRAFFDKVAIGAKAAGGTNKQPPPSLASSSAGPGELDELTEEQLDAMQATDLSGSVIEVTCPDDAVAGTVIDVRTPGGQQIKATVPEGIAPGQNFQVQYTPPTPAWGAGPATNSNNSKGNILTNLENKKKELLQQANLPTDVNQLVDKTKAKAKQVTLKATGKSPEEWFDFAKTQMGNKMEEALALHDNEKVNKLLDNALASRFMTSKNVPNIMRKAAKELISNQLRTAIASENPKVLKGSLVAAKRLHVIDVPEFEQAVQKYKEVKKLPQGWDVGRMVLHREGNKMLHKLHLTDQAVMAKFQRLLDVTMRKVYTRDRLGQPVPDRLQLVSVVAVENEELWGNFMARREVIRREIEADPKDAKLAEPAETMLAKEKSDEDDALAIVETLANDFAEPLLPGVNEVFLFHGTSAAAASKITTEDFKLNLAGSAAGILYGRGVYFAENSTKSDEYTKPIANGDRILIICRCLLGRPYYLDKKDVDPRECEKACLHGRFHSVLGDRKKCRGTFREFVVFDEEQVYPNYVLTYRRAGGTVDKTRSCEAVCPAGVSPGDTIAVKAPDGRTYNVIVPPGVGFKQKFMAQY